jgi:hypothetical protein
MGMVLQYSTTKSDAPLLIHHLYLVPGRQHRKPLKLSHYLDYKWWEVLAMCENEIINRLAIIEKKQRESRSRAEAAFGLAVLAIGYNFLGTGKTTNLKVASVFIIALGLALFVKGLMQIVRDSRNKS